MSHYAEFERIALGDGEVVLEWACSAFLSDLMRDGLFEKLALRGKRVLELGAGSGRLSMLMQERGAKVCAADIEPELSLLRRNTGGSGVRVVELLWGKEGWARSFLSSERPFDVVVCADLIALEDTHEDLLYTLRQVVRETTTCVFCIKNRDDFSMHFMVLLHDAGVFEVEDLASAGEGDDEGEILAYKVTRCRSDDASPLTCFLCFVWCLKQAQLWLPKDLLRLIFHETRPGRLKIEYGKHTLQKIAKGKRVNFPLAEPLRSASVSAQVLQLTGGRVGHRKGVGLRFKIKLRVADTSFWQWFKQAEQTVLNSLPSAVRSQAYESARVGDDVLLLRYYFRRVNDCVTFHHTEEGELTAVSSCGNADVCVGCTLRLTFCISGVDGFHEPMRLMMGADELNFKPRH